MMLEIAVQKVSPYLRFEMTEQQKALQALLEQLQETKADAAVSGFILEREITPRQDGNNMVYEGYINKFRLFPAASEFTVLKMVG